MKRLFSYLISAAATLILCGSCITFSKDSSPRLNLPNLVYAQTNIMLAAPVSALGEALAGSDADQFNVVGSVNKVTYTVPASYAFFDERVFECHMVITCLAQDIWVVTPDPEGNAGTLYSNFSFLNRIELVSRDSEGFLFNSSFQGAEDDQNGLTASLENSSRGDIKIKLNSGSKLVIRDRISRGTINGTVLFETFYNGKGIDGGNIVFEGETATVNYSPS